jgi:ankyrin repeat protein
VNQATTDTGSTPLYVASHNGHAAVVEVLLGKGASATAPMTNNVTPLMVAAHFGHRGCVELLLLAVDAAVGVRMTGWNEVLKAGEGTTALQLATTAGHLAIAELIEGG